MIPDPVAARPQAPTEIALMFCTTCGRDDRYRPFTGKSHWAKGAKCAGKPLIIYYTRNDLA